MNWYVIYTKPKTEDSVVNLLVNAGIEALNPKIRVKKYVRRRYVDVIEPLFPGYIFAFFDKGMHSHMIRYTRGVKYVVGKAHPIAVPAEIIDAIRSRLEGDLIRQDLESLEQGDRVLIKEGPFMDFYGIFERNLPGKRRAMILLELLHCKLEIETRSLKKS